MSEKHIQSAKGVIFNFYFQLQLKLQLKLQLLAWSGNQFGTSVFFLADAPARYNAWDEFVLYRFIAFAGNEFGTSLFFTLCFV